MASSALALYDPSGLPLANTPAVLVVDNDPGSTSHCAGILGDLGYPYHTACSARESLELLGSNPSISILLANVQTPAMDGLALIEEVRARIGEARPVAIIMLAEKVTAELAVKGMHLEAVDVLIKSCGLEPYSAALRRAMRYLATRRSAADNAGLSNVSHHLTRLLAVLETSHAPAAIEGRASDREIAATLRCLIASRTLRTRFFPGDIFADPAWDILLDLTRANLENQNVSVSSVCIAASVPMSTALRWVRQMTEDGLLQRWTDPKDRRRDLVALTEKSRTSMMEFLTIVHGMLKKV